jgi:hypothetical protein
VRIGIGPVIVFKKKALPGKSKISACLISEAGAAVVTVIRLTYVYFVTQGAPNFNKNI